SSGIGLAITKRLLMEGAHVYGIGHDEMASSFEHERFSYSQADLSQKGMVNKTFEKALEFLGDIDMYVANAGQARYTLATQLSEADRDFLFRLNADAVIEAMVRMKNHHGERPFTFAVTSSIMAEWPLPGYAVYSATKAAVSAFVKGMRHELSESQKAHLLYPVATATHFFNVSGQSHTPWMMQSPEHVSKIFIKGLKKNRLNIRASKMFTFVHRWMPFLLNKYLKREKTLLSSSIEKKHRTHQ
ncbi:MAG: SDR family NAD(P)-dependent oxidoreductase, partial [Bacillota bacterium]